MQSAIPELRASGPLPHQAMVGAFASMSLLGRHRGTATTPGGTSSRPSKNAVTSAWRR